MSNGGLGGLYKAVALPLQATGPSSSQDGREGCLSPLRKETERPRRGERLTSLIDALRPVRGPG